MSRHRNYNPEDDAPLTDGDTKYIGVREDLPAHLIPPGFVAGATNSRFVDGEAVPRGGIQILPWMTGDGRTPFIAPLGAGVFKDPSGLEWIMVAANGGIYATRPSNVASAVPCAAALAEDCRFTQAFDHLLLGRGFSAVPLEMKSFNTGFVTVTQQTSGAGNGTGTFVIPNFLFAEFIQNRLAIVGENDLGYVTDILNYTRCSIENATRINQGGDDTLLRFFKYNETSAMAFKGKHIYQVLNLIPDQDGNWSAAVLDEITSDHGLASAAAVVMAGSDLFYFGTKGLTSISRTAQDKLRSLDIPLSEQLKVSFGRINWKYIDQATLEEWDNKLYLAVPLDDGQVYGPNVVPATAVYDEFGNYLVPGLTFHGRYRWLPDVNDPATPNSVTAAEFTSGGVTLPVVAGTPGATVTARLQAVSYGNNAVMVYDLKNQAWAGVDEADSITQVKVFIKFTHHGQLRLGFLSYDGYLRLYEEGFEDELVKTIVNPHVDVTVGLPPTGDTIQVNGGDELSADNLGPNVGNLFWGALDIDSARANIWEGDFVGYNPASQFPWTTPGAVASRIDWGVRFTSSSGDGVTVKINGVAVVATGYYGTIPALWAYVELQNGAAITCVPVQQTVLTRGMTCGNPSDPNDVNAKARKVFDVGKLQLATWSPEFSVTAIVDGVNEERVLITARTKSRTDYTVFGRTPWDPSNVNGDHGNPYRQDYSVVPDPGTIFDPGINPDQHQELDQPVRINTRGRRLQLRLTNTDGRCKLQSMAIEARQIDRGMAPKI